MFYVAISFVAFTNIYTINENRDMLKKQIYNNQS